ncbi:hypothetical protein HNY73_009910 [Argiope bruennichi]|uniref:Uncharacterized protein n=1 Tax=Argiope bruennichi TaxID=94029 RepID=A0A8T0FG39_ARGBR|nr:hypothetical protein HNY73_009910 [Argiope bruennichi]
MEANQTITDEAVKMHYAERRLPRRGGSVHPGSVNPIPVIPFPGNICARLPLHSTRSCLPERGGVGTVNTHSSCNHSNLRGYSRVLLSPTKNSSVPPPPSNYSTIVCVRMRKPWNRLFTMPLREISMSQFIPSSTLLFLQFFPNLFLFLYSTWMSSIGLDPDSKPDLEQKEGKRRGVGGRKRERVHSPMMWS